MDHPELQPTNPQPLVSLFTSEDTVANASDIVYLEMLGEFYESKLQEWEKEREEAGLIVKSGPDDPDKGVTKRLDRSVHIKYVAHLAASISIAQRFRQSLKAHPALQKHPASRLLWDAIMETIRDTPNINDPAFLARARTQMGELHEPFIIYDVPRVQDAIATFPPDVQAYFKAAAKRARATVSSTAAEARPLGSDMKVGFEDQP